MNKRAYHERETWEESLMNETRRHVLETIQHVNDRFDKDDDKRFSSTQLDDLKDCLKILCKLENLEDDEPEHMHSGTMVK